MRLGAHICVKFNKEIHYKEVHMKVRVYDYPIDSASYNSYQSIQNDERVKT